MARCHGRGVAGSRASSGQGMGPTAGFLAPAAIVCGWPPHFTCARRTEHQTPRARRKLVACSPRAGARLARHPVINLRQSHTSRWRNAKRNRVARIIITRIRVQWSGESLRAGADDADPRHRIVARAPTLRMLEQRSTCVCSISNRGQQDTSAGGHGPSLTVH